MAKIRFGYCPPNPGPKKKLRCKWYTDKNTATEEYDGGSPIYIQSCGRYHEITFEQLLNLKTMDFKKLQEKREHYNSLILNKLHDILDKNPDLRFNQLMYIINGTDDYFNEESWVTYKRISEKFPNS